MTLHEMLSLRDRYAVTRKLPCNCDSNAGCNRRPSPGRKPYVKISLVRCTVGKPFTRSMNVLDTISHLSDLKARVLVQAKSNQDMLRVVPSRRPGAARCIRVPKALTISITPPLINEYLTLPQKGIVQTTMQMTEQILRAVNPGIVI